MIIIYTDGASRGNPGPSGAGIYIKSEKRDYRYIVPLGEMTNHEAEFHAIIFALEICQEKFPGEILSFRTDAKVVVDLVEKAYTKNADYQPLLDRINKLSESFPYVFIKWIPDRDNTNADELAKEAIDATTAQEIYY